MPVNQFTITISTICKADLVVDRCVHRPGGVGSRLTPLQLGSRVLPARSVFCTCVSEPASTHTSKQKKEKIPTLCPLRPLLQATPAQERPKKLLHFCTLLERAFLLVHCRTASTARLDNLKKKRKARKVKESTNPKRQTKTKRNTTEK